MTLEAMLHKIARQLVSMDEASLMALWDTYHGKVKHFEPTRSWEEACVIFGLIQAVRWKNQLFNSHWAGRHEASGAKQEQNEQPPEGAFDHSGDQSSDRGKVIRLYPKGDSLTDG